MRKTYLADRIAGFATLHSNNAVNTGGFALNEEHLSELRAIGARLDARVPEIAADRLLSPIGRATKLQEAGRASLAALQSWKEKVVGAKNNQVKAKLATLAKRAARPAPADGVEALLRELRAQEIRRTLEKIADDPIKMRIKYMSADEETRAAIEDAPFPMVDAEFLEAQALGRIEAEAPEDVETLRKLQAQRDAYETLGSTLEVWLREIASVPTDATNDPIAELAARDQQND